MVSQLFSERLLRDLHELTRILRNMDGAASLPALRNIQNAINRLRNTRRVFRLLYNTMFAVKSQ